MPSYTPRLGKQLFTAAPNWKSRALHILAPWTDFGILPNALDEAVCSDPLEPKFSNAVRFDKKRATGLEAERRRRDYSCVTAKCLLIRLDPSRSYSSTLPDTTQHLNGLRVPRWLSRLQRPHAGPPHGSGRSSGAACLPGVAGAIGSLVHATSHRFIDDYRIIDEPVGCLGLAITQDEQTPGQPIRRRHVLQFQPLRRLATLVPLVYRACSSRGAVTFS